MVKKKLKLRRKDTLVLGLIAIVVSVSFLVSLLAKNAVILDPIDSELGQENSDASGLVINEIMANNNGALADPEGKIYDWIELYNGGDKEIKLLNYGLSDTLDKTKWVFHNITMPAKSYLVVYLCGVKKDGPYTNFRLKGGGGETLVLRNPSGNVLASYVLPEIEENKSIGRGGDGKWVVFRQSTPGYENSTAGYLVYATARKSTASPLKITEYLPRNQGNFLLKNVGFPGYIEITNISDKSVDLNGYYLGESADVPFRWKFPAKTIKAGQSIVVYTSGRAETENYLSTSFKLSEGSGSVMLADNKGRILDQSDYQGVVNGYAMVWQTDRFVTQPFLSPGYGNDPAGTQDYNEARGLPVGLIINEAMTSNTKYLPQNGAEHYDWIELKNNSKNVIHLGEYTLTTSQNTPDMYKLPNADLNPGEYYIIMASGDANLSNNSYKHANFKLADVESLYLYHQGQIGDAAFLAEIPVNYSLARTDKGGFVYSATPTPKAANTSGYYLVSAEVKSSIEAGVYNDIDKLTVALETQGKTYYTLDGSRPNTNSAVYAGPINVNKTMTIRAVTIEPRKVPGSIATFSYIVNENHVFPVVSVAMNPADFKKLQGDPWRMGVEFASHVDLFEEGKGFSIDCGFQLFGGSTRGLPKKSFELNFRSEYGPGLLHYQVFENRDFAVFNKLVLRSGSQDYVSAYFRDILGSEIMDQSETVEVQAYKSIVLYINSKYWGVYDIREKVDEYFVATHYNVTPKTANVVRADLNVSAGSNRGVYAIVNYAGTHDMTLDANYKYITDRLDIDSYIDFWVAENFVTNNDIINTRYISSPDNDSGKYNMVFYDLDFAWYNYTKDYYQFMVNPAGMSALKVSTTLMRNLILNADFKGRFLERLKLNLEGIWSEANVSAKIEMLYQKMKPEMARDHTRWGLTMANWEDEVDVLRNYAKVRTHYLLETTKSFFGLSDAQFNAYFGAFV